jgi:hypothetical protein
MKHECIDEQIEKSKIQTVFNKYSIVVADSS